MAITKTKKTEARAEVEKSNAVAVVPQNGTSVIGDLAAQLRCRPDKLMPLLKTTVFRNCKRNEEFQMACMVAREYRLNPILKEIYAFPSQNGVVPIVSIDGWIRIINSHPKYAGCKFAYAGSIKGEGGGDLSCTCAIFRTDRKEPIEVQEFYEECYRDTDPWNGMPRRMLRWKALIQCARVAFGFAGIYDFDEGNDILSHDGKHVTKDGDIVDVEVKPISREEDKPSGDNVFEDEPDPTEEEEDGTHPDRDIQEDGDIVDDEEESEEEESEETDGEDAGGENADGEEFPW